jgi:hypothetical protein
MACSDLSAGNASIVYTKLGSDLRELLEEIEK